jgi:phosphatidylglycerophosphatase A
MSIGDRLLFVLITGFGTGLAPFASGTFGTLPAVAIGWLMQHYWFKEDGDHRSLAIALIVLAVVLFAIGFFTTGFVERVLLTKDPKPFVLDEIVGYFVTLGMFCFLAQPTIYTHGAAFFFFRLFDVLKPSPARELENWKGAPGIMSDDVVAGIYAGLVLIGLHYFFPGLI